MRPGAADGLRYFRVRTGGRTAYAREEDGALRLLSGPPYAPHTKLERIPFSEAALLAPVEPSKIMAVGLNYRSHALEMNMPIPAEPILFLKPLTALNGPGWTVAYPAISRQLEYEGELVIVIGKSGRHISEEAVPEHIFGYTLANDITARDLQKKDGQWARAKGFDGFCPVGPCVAVLRDISDLRFETLVNGTVKQTGCVSDMIFSVPQIVSFISQVMTLLPGDIILTGTPPGIGPLRIGDEVGVRSGPIGTLSNTIVPSP